MELALIECPQETESDEKERLYQIIVNRVKNSLLEATDPEAYLERQKKRAEEMALAKEEYMLHLDSL
jgi:hypothetical protein